MVARGCLGDDTIAAMLDGALAGEHAELARAHIVTCDDCRRLVSAAIGSGAADAAPTSPGPATAAIAPGSALGGSYRIEQLIAEGGMGRLYRAVQHSLDRPVAIKVMRPDIALAPHALARFCREARLVAALRSPHVVRVHDFGTTDAGEPYLVMELLDGHDLDQHVRAHGPVSPEQATAWLLDACDALGEAHALGIVHRDIKPSNLLVEPGRGVVVLDFGLAKLAASNLTAAGSVLGAPRFMAPEQRREARAVDARTDVWALGAVLHFLLTARSPYDTAAGPADLAAIARGEINLALDRMPRRLADVASRALAVDPAARFGHAAELASALRASALPAGLSARFELLEKIGEGTHGAVYRARPLPSGRDVALKVLRTAAGSARDRFEREAAIVQRLEHPNSVRLLDAGVADDGTRFLAFELVRGRTLADEIASGPLMPARVSRIAVQVLKALAEAHACGVVHRDVTPSNILLVDYFGDPDFVKLLDFGVAADAASPRVTSTGAMIGTPRYMAPEQIASAGVDARADLYALGLVLAEALTGVPVYAEETAYAVCARKLGPEPVPLSADVAAGPLGDVIARATARRPQDRFATAGEMLAMVERGPVGGVRQTPPVPPPVVVARRRRALVPAVAVLAAAATAAVAFGVWRGDPPPEATPAQRPATPEPAEPPMFALIPGPEAVPQGPRTAPSGALVNVSEESIRRRVAKLGWTVKEVSKFSHPGVCGYTRFQLGRDGDQRAWADVYLRDCDSDAEAQRILGLHRDGDSWSGIDGSRVMSVSTPSPGTPFSDQAASRQLFDALLVP